MSAAVLTGGRSRRMGEPKAVLRLEPDAPTLIELVVAALRRVAIEVFLVGQPSWALPSTLAEMRIVEDAQQGAADGVIAALGAAKHDFCIVVGCDMPFLEPSLLLEMIAIAQTHNRSVLAHDSAGAHPLHTVYRREDRKGFEARVAAGERSLTTIAVDLGAIAVDIGSHDMRRWSVFNVNTPTDLAMAREHALECSSTEGEALK